MQNNVLWMRCGKITSIKVLEHGFWYTKVMFMRLMQLIEKMILIDIQPHPEEIIRIARLSLEPLNYVSHVNASYL